MEKDNRYFNPDNTTHQDLVDAVEQVLKNTKGKPLETPSLATKIDEETNVMSESSAKSLLYYAREYIIEHKDVETERGKGEGGSAPWEWRYSK